MRLNILVLCYDRLKNKLFTKKFFLNLTMCLSLCFVVFFVVVGFLDIEQGDAKNISNRQALSAFNDLFELYDVILGTKQHDDVVTIHPGIPATTIKVSPEQAAKGSIVLPFSATVERAEENTTVTYVANTDVSGHWNPLQMAWTGDVYTEPILSPFNGFLDLGGFLAVDQLSASVFVYALVNAVETTNQATLIYESSSHAVNHTIQVVDIDQDNNAFPDNITDIGPGEAWFNQIAFDEDVWRDVGIIHLNPDNDAFYWHNISNVTLQVGNVRVTAPNLAALDNAEFYDSSMFEIIDDAWLVLEVAPELRALIDEVDGDWSAQAITAWAEEVAAQQPGGLTGGSPFLNVKIAYRLMLDPLNIRTMNDLRTNRHGADTGLSVSIEISDLDIEHPDAVKFWSYQTDLREDGNGFTAAAAVVEWVLRDVPSIDDEGTSIVAIVDQLSILGALESGMQLNSVSPNMVPVGVERDLTLAGLFQTNTALNLAEAQAAYEVLVDGESVDFREVDGEAVTAYVGGENFIYVTLPPQAEPGFLDVTVVDILSDPVVESTLVNAIEVVDTVTLTTEISGNMGEAWIEASPSSEASLPEGAYVIGETVTALVYFDENVESFIGWLLNSEPVGANASITFIMDQNIELVAQFQPATILYGDVNQDGVIDFNDVNYLIDLIFEGVDQLPVNDPIRLAADVNRDGQITTDDALMIMLYVNSGGLILSEPKELRAESGSELVTLFWRPVSHPNLASYAIYRRKEGDQFFQKIGTTTNAQFTNYNVDTAKYEYYVVTLDILGNEGAPSTTVSLFANTLRLWIPEVWGKPGDEVRVPINLGNTRGLTPKTIALDLEINPNILIYKRFSRTVLSQDIAINQNMVGDVLQFISIDPNLNIGGEGRFLDIIFEINPSVNVESTQVKLNSARILDTLDNPVNVNLQSGLVMIGDDSMWGDLNKDGVVNRDDVQLLLDIVVRKEQPTSYHYMVGDLNGDGRLDSADAVLLLRMISGQSINPDGNDKGYLTGLKQQNWVIGLSDQVARKGQRIALPVTLNDISYIAGGDIIFSWPHDKLQFKDLYPAGIFADRDYKIESGQDFANLSFAGDKESTKYGSDVIAEIVFTVLAEPSSDENPAPVLRINYTDLKLRFGESVLWYGDIELANARIFVEEGSIEDTAVPNLYNMPLSEAEELIRNANLMRGDVTEEVSDNIAVGNVIRQDPAANTMVQAGTSVDLVISIGPGSKSKSCGCNTSAQPDANPYGNLLLIAALTLLLIVRAKRQETIAKM